MTNDPQITHRVPEFLQNKELRLIFFGGKGGVGKTTMAAASGLYVAKSRGEDKKVLVISTDPAHSLSDSLGMAIGDQVTAIQMSEVGGQMSDVGGQKSEVRGRRAEGGGQRAEVGGRRSEVGGRRLEVPGQREEVGGWRLEVGGQEEDRQSHTDWQGPTTNDHRMTMNDGRRPNDSEANDVLVQDPMTNDHCPMTNLFARELNAGRLLDEFKQKNHDVIKKLAARGTYFDDEDIAGFFDLSLPGMDEVMAVIEIANLLKQRTYDIVIVDTAPTGHTVRMLNLPRQMLKWIETMDLMQHKHRYLSEVFSGKKYRKDACDQFLEDLSSDIDRVRRLLSNGEMTRFVPVMIPEPMSIYETERLIDSLEKNEVPVREIIVNHVAESDECAFCRSRRQDQKMPLKEIEDRFSRYEKVRIPVFPHEVRGISGLRTIAAYLSGTFKPFHPVGQNDVVEAPGGCLALDPGLEFVLIGGKGGVGKTTLASSVALLLAQHNPGKRVLLFSTDPAHSLSDSLNQAIGDQITPVQCSAVSGQASVERVRMTNLFALEIDADRLWGDFKETFKRDIEALFDRFVARGADIRFDREVMTELLELAPPGVDEIMSLDRIMDLRNEGAFDIFVLDTSPTGHLLRFLELPDLVRKWLKAFFGLLLKYKGVVSLSAAAEKALALSRNVRRIQETLTDPEKTDFVAATIPEAMGVFELERLIAALQAGKIPCRHIVVNKVVPKTDCAFCSIKRGEQQDYIRKILSIFPDRTIVQAPLFPRQIQGLDDLKELVNAICCNPPKGPEQSKVHLYETT